MSTVCCCVVAHNCEHIADQIAIHVRLMRMKGLTSGPATVRVLQPVPQAEDISVDQMQLRHCHRSGRSHHSAQTNRAAFNTIRCAQMGSALAHECHQRSCRHGSPRDILVSITPLPALSAAQPALSIARLSITSIHAKRAALPETGRSGGSPHRAAQDGADGACSARFQGGHWASVAGSRGPVPPAR